MAVAEETFCEDLINGVALCKLMTMIQGSGVSTYHDLPSPKGAPLDSFKSRENVRQFLEACTRMKMPVTFGTAELEQKNLFQIASTLLFVVHTATSQGVGVQALKEDAELTERVRAVTEAAVNAESGEASAASASASAASTEGLSWWQQLLVRFGFGDWLETLDPEKLKAYAAQLKQRVEDKAAEVQTQVLEQTASFKAKAAENLPESLKSRISA